MLFIPNLGIGCIGVIAYQMRDQKIDVALYRENIRMLFVLINIGYAYDRIVYEFILNYVLEGIILFFKKERRQIQAEKAAFPRDPLVKLVSVYNDAVALAGGHCPIAAAYCQRAALKEKDFGFLVPMKIEVARH